VRSSASGLAIGVAYPRRRGPERIRSASSRSRSRSTRIIREGQGLTRSVRRISRSGGELGRLASAVALLGDGSGWSSAETIQPWNGRPAGGSSRCGLVRQAGFQRTV
jgi:hypothetical protein